MTKPGWFAHHDWESRFVRDDRREFNPLNTVHVFDILKTLRKDNPPKEIADSLEPLVRTYRRAREQLDTILQEPREKALGRSAAILEKNPLDEKTTLGERAETTLYWALWNLLIQELERVKEIENIKMAEGERLISGAEVDQWSKFLCQLLLAKITPQLAATFSQ